MSAIEEADDDPNPNKNPNPTWMQSSLKAA